MRSAFCTSIARGALGLLFLSCGVAAGAEPPEGARAPEIAAIYFPGFHRDGHMDGWLGEGFTEWKLLMGAEPRFPGHRLLRPEWGSFDEADPAWMVKQIDLAAEHGIGVFVFDWYWYDGVKILHRPLEEGFLKARNRAKLKYALMWANHDWRNVFPAPLDGRATVWLPSRATPEDFRRHMAHCIATHFNQPNYWRTDGAIYFSIFAPEAFVRQLGGPEGARAVVEVARRQIEEAGLGKLHLGGFGKSPAAAASLRDAGFDSLTTYNITASGKARMPDRPLDEYTDLIERHEASWKELDSGVLPYAPVVTMGWDCTPRWVKDCPWPPPKVGYPYTTVVVGNTPQRFGDLCRKAKAHVESSKLRPPLILINAWNEWTEGSALLPEAKHGTRYLEAVREAFGPDVHAPGQAAAADGSAPPRPKASISAPYPPSPVIARIEWAPKESIIREAKDGDNWPLTWADDDALYTTWGDGTGFVPKVEKKLSMGFARLTGMPDRFIGVNVRSDAEQLGQGRSGKKGWGILCVDGVLYLWLGHADNKGATAQLAWSRDHARTWTFADWKFAEFGLVGFVNFGRDYAGARDEFVYAYSHDGQEADTPADRFILMRAPMNGLTQREAWEFFVSVDADGQPVWTRDINRRGTAFRNPGACLRSAMTYCAPLKRYLWWQHIPQPPGVTNDRGDTRFSGGFGVYDAPEPWGPWTTAFFTENWDVGPGEHGDFPTKWMSADGTALNLVFSGEDTFSVRMATLHVGSHLRSQK